MANRTPFGAALAFQRDAARMGQRTVEQGLEAQRAMTESFVRNAIGMGRAANRNATEATRRSAVAVAGLTDATVPASPDTRTSVEHGFDAMADLQENAWRVVEESAEDGLATYAEIAGWGMGAFADTVDATLPARERAGRGRADAALEYERQRPERTATRRQAEETAGPAEPETIPVAEGEGDVETETAETDPESEVEEPDPESAVEEPDSESEVEETGPESEVEAVVPDVGLEDVSGIGSAYAARLRGAGIDSVESLRDADVAELSDSTEISDERIENWQRQARHLLEGDD